MAALSFVLLLSYVFAALIASSNAAQSLSNISPAAPNKSISILWDDYTLYELESNGQLIGAITNKTQNGTSQYYELAAYSEYYNILAPLDFKSATFPPPSNMCPITDFVSGFINTKTALIQLLEGKYTEPGPAAVSGSIVVFSTSYSGPYTNYGADSSVGPYPLNKTLANQILQNATLIDVLALESLTAMLTTKSPASCVSFGPVTGGETFSEAPISFGWIATTLFINTCSTINPLAHTTTDGFAKDEIVAMLEECASAP